MLAKYLATIESPMHRAKIETALLMQVRHNGGEFLWRHELIERKVACGARVRVSEYKVNKGERILQSPDGAFFDTRNITATGIAYAEWLIAQLDILEAELENDEPPSDLMATEGPWSGGFASNH